MSGIHNHREVVVSRKLDHAILSFKIVLISVKYRSSFMPTLLASFGAQLPRLSCLK